MIDNLLFTLAPLPATVSTYLASFSAMQADEISFIVAAWILGLPLLYIILQVTSQVIPSTASLFPHRLLMQTGHSRRATVRILAETSLLLAMTALLAHQRAIPNDWLADGLLLILAAYLIFSVQLARRLNAVGLPSTDGLKADPPHTLLIEPGLAERHYWRDLWRYRELFYVLAWRDISVRYKQTIIGLAWALIRPFLTMVVFTVVFGRIAKLPSDGTSPYALMVYAGLLPWQFFSTALSESSNSLISNANLISKVYFPRLIVPTAAVVVSFIDFLISFVILVGLMLWYQFLPGWSILTLPFFVIMSFLASLGPGLWITALNVKYRDFRYIIPFIVQFGLYVSPVGFSSSIVPEKWRLLYSINPVVGVIDGFRWAILGGESTLYMPGFLLSCGIIVFFLWLGIRQFRGMEKSFADLI